MLEHTVRVSIPFFTRHASSTKQSLISVFNRCYWTHTYKKFLERESIKKLNKGLVRFPTVAKVKPKHFNLYFRNDLKLRSLWEDSTENPGIELLHNISCNYDQWIVRSSQSLLYYYRLEMLAQRVNYLERLDMLPKEKWDHINEFPPALIFTFDSTDYGASLVYLRGLVKEDHVKSLDGLEDVTSPGDYLHMFYPACKKITLSKADIENRIALLEKDLGVSQFAILKQLMRMPCFYLNPVLLEEIKHVFIHLLMLPFKFNVDKQTLHMYPPVCKLGNNKFGDNLFTYEEFCSNNISKDKLLSLPLFQIEEVLDYSYRQTADYGDSSPECMSTFLIRADFEEFKDRTGGQKIPGIRGFNVPKRQY